MIPLALFALAGCAAVSPGSDRVLLRDLAAAFPDAALAAETPVALAPAPGVERRFDLPDLRRIAARFALPEPARAVCVTRSVAPLDAARILAAMQSALPGAEIEVVDFSRWPAPEGMLEFPAGGLHGDRWTGVVRYAGGRRFSVWAKVRIRATGPHVVAARDLKAGQHLAATDLRLETEGSSPDPRPASLADLLGKRLRRAVRAGTPVRAAWTDTPPDVSRGDAVAVEVHSGAAVLSFEGRALGTGNAGQPVSVVNPETRKRIQARVEGPGRVTLQGDPQ